MAGRFLAVVVSVGLALLAAGPPRADAGAIKPGDILVGDLDVSGIGQSNDAAILDVNPLTGARSIFTGAGTGAGPALEAPRGIAFLGDGTVLVADSGNGTLLKVNPITGDRTLLASGFTQPLGVTADTLGNIYVVDGGAGIHAGLVDRVIASSGIVTPVTATFGDNPVGITIDGNGKLIVTDLGSLTDPGTVFRIDPTTGNVVVVSGGAFNIGGVANLITPRGVAVDKNGRIDVADSGGTITGVDPVTGDRTIISGNGVGGTTFTLPYGLALDAAGQILMDDIGDPSVPTFPLLLGINPVTGAGTIISGGVLGSGPGFGALDIGLAVVPAAGTPPPPATPEPSSLLLMALGLAGLLGFGRRKSR